MRTMLLPLRTNAAWFLNHQNLDVLRQRLKAALILYDKVFVQDGRYHCTIFATGSMDGILSPQMLQGRNREQISFHQPGRHAQLAVSDGPGAKQTVLLGGVALAFFEADFYPLLQEAGIRDHPSIELFSGDWNDETKRQAKQFLFHHQSGLFGAQPVGEHFQKSKWAEVYLMDTLAAFQLGLPVSMDQRAESLANWIRTEKLAQLRNEIPAIFLHEWVQIGLPDFTNEPWDRIIEIHDSSAGTAFRQLISDIESEILTESPHISEAGEVGEIVRRKLTSEIVDELLQRRSTVGQAIVSLGLNFTPVGLIGNVKEFWGSFKEGRSWINLLKKK